MVATVLTVYGIETGGVWDERWSIGVATVLTVYGIETKSNSISLPLADQLQQYLPFTVLKPYFI